MEIRWHILLAIMGASVVTLLPRVLPLVLLSRMQLPEWTMRWLNYVPVAVMAALIAQELFTTDGKVHILQHYVEILAAIPTFATAILTRSLLGTVVVGILSLMALRFVL